MVTWGSSFYHWLDSPCSPFLLYSHCLLGWFSVKYTSLEASDTLCQVSANIFSCYDMSKCLPWKRSKLYKSHTSFNNLSFFSYRWMLNRCSSLPMAVKGRDIHIQFSYYRQQHTGWVSFISTFITDTWPC